MSEKIRDRIIGGIIAFLLTIIFGMTFVTARDASCGVNVLRERTTVLETKFEIQQATLSEIKKTGENMAGDIRAILIRMGGKDGIKAN